MIIRTKPKRVAKTFSTWSEKIQDLVDRIKEERDFGVIHCGIIEAAPKTQGELAGMFGLKTSDDIYSEINREDAHKIISFVLKEDLAYGFDVDPPFEYNPHVEEFLMEFDTSHPRFFTNGNWHESGSTRTWSDATDATFDTGVLVLGKPYSGCLWVEDED